MRYSLLPTYHTLKMIDISSRVIHVYVESELNTMRLRSLYLNMTVKRDTSRNAIVIEEVLWSIRGSYKNTKFLSHECWVTFYSLDKYNDNLPQIRLCTNPWTRPFTDLREVFIEHLRPPSMLTGDAYSYGHFVPSHLGLAYVLLVETNLFPELVCNKRYLSGLCYSNIPRYFLDFASKGRRSSNTNETSDYLHTSF